MPETPEILIEAVAAQQLMRNKKILATIGAGTLATIAVAVAFVKSRSDETPTPE